MAQVLGIIGAVGVVVTIMGMLASGFFQLGRHAARLEALEKWRDGIRQDMHEISLKLTEVEKILQHLTTLIEERTERRSADRPAVRPGGD